MKHLKEASEPAILALANGAYFQGSSIGVAGQTVGEVVFNTSMSGYQEILSDPSYAEQMVTLTYPHIGNVGVNADDQESRQGVWAAGLIIRDLSLTVSNWRAQGSLQNYLVENNIVAIADIDTRALVHVLRQEGAQQGCIMTGTHDPTQALAYAKDAPGLVGKDLARLVTTSAAFNFQEGSFSLDKDKPSSDPVSNYHVVVYDFGVKQQILRSLVDRGCRLTIVPATTSVAEVMAMAPDGVVFSNGPGDPAACDYAIATAQALMAQKIPLLGICLGFQIIALACGATTIKMKFGHHGANHPVQNIATKVVAITSQNHGFAVDQQTLPAHLAITHLSLFDGSLQGFCHRQLPVLGLQGHPEASPGPHDIATIFDDFIAYVIRKKTSLCQKDKI